MSVKKFLKNQFVKRRNLWAVSNPLYWLDLIIQLLTTLLRFFRNNKKDD